MNRFIYAVVIACLLAGCGGAPEQPTVTPAPTSVYEGLQQFTGNRGHQTNPVVITAPAATTVYLAHSGFRTGLNDSGTCQMNAVLVKGGAVIQDLTSETTQSLRFAEEGWRQSPPFSIEPGEYVLDVNSNCDWLVLLGPIK